MVVDCGIETASRDHETAPKPSTQREPPEQHTIHATTACCETPRLLCALCAIFSWYTWTYRRRNVCCHCCDREAAA
jgi:hypothetical protein